MKLSKRLGIGPTVSGTAVVLSPDKCLETSSLDATNEGKILVCQAYVGRELIAKATFLGVAAIVVPSIHYRDLASFATNPEISIVLVKRFGEEELTGEERQDMGHWNLKKITITNDDGSYEIAAAA